MEALASYRISMTSMSSRALTAAYQRPRKLFRYSQQQYLERSLHLGEFRLRLSGPPAASSGSSSGILPFGARPVATAFLTLSLADRWDERLFDTFGGADCCLVINNTEEFGERIHRAVQRMLPTWAGIDGAVSYGTPSPLGAAFSKAKPDAIEGEWQFAWRPTQPELGFHPVIIRIGSIESIAELRTRTTHA